MDSIKTPVTPYRLPAADLSLKFPSQDCACNDFEFLINGYRAEYQDFGAFFDYDPKSAPSEHGCGDRVFLANETPSKKVLEKYWITPEEYADICESLERILHRGKCDFCNCTTGTGRAGLLTKLKNKVAALLGFDCRVLPYKEDTKK